MVGRDSGSGGVAAASAVGSVARTECGSLASSLDPVMLAALIMSYVLQLKLKHRLGRKVVSKW